KSIKRNKQPIVGASSTPQVMAIQGGRVQKYKPQGNAKGKGKGPQNSYPTKPKKPQPYKKERPKKDGQCHHCKEEGHWKRKCPVYLPELIKKENRRSKCCIRFFSNKRTKSNLDSTYLWHCRLPQINKKRIEKLQHGGLLKSTDNEPFDQCVSCISGKMTRKPFSHKTEKVKDVLGLIHTDVCGPLRHLSKKGASYFITFTDDYSRYGYVYLLKHKHEVFETFKVFKSEVKNQLEKTIKAIRSDHGGEYISQEFKDYLKACGIIQQLTPSYTPQHNGVSERRNRTLLNMVQSMMSLATLSLSFWDYALESAARILNMVPTKKVDKTSYELWHGKVLNLSYLKVWGYPKETMGYYLYYPPENKIVVERYANFLEKDFILQKESGRIVKLEDVIPVRRSVRKHKAPDRFCLNVEIDPDRLCFNVEVEEHNLGDLNEPANYKSALSDPKFEKWLVAMNAEMQSMYKSCTKTYGVDYEETFSPVSDIRAIRILIAIAAYYDYEIWQMDVKTAFLNGFLEEEIYMEQPEEMKRMQNVPYASAVGSIMYAVRYVFVLNGGAGVWKSSKQTTTAQHAIEAEYIAASKAAKEVVWIRKFIDELDVVPSNDYPMKMNCTILL
nr:hypothetical protein [Tanacetum cinerariifolium]